MNILKAVKNAEKDYRGLDSDRNANIDEVHRLTKAGVSATNIAVLVGMSDRQVQRMRGVAEAPKRWYQFDKSEKRSAKLEETATAAIDLACRIRDEDPQLVFRSLDLLNRHDLQELTMILLAGFPIELTVDEIFEWVLP